MSLCAVIGLATLISKRFNGIYNSGNELLLLGYFVYTPRYFEPLTVCALTDVIWMEAEANAFAMRAITTPLTKKVTIGSERSYKNHMSVRETVGQPLSELLQEFSISAIAF